MSNITRIPKAGATELRKVIDHILRTMPEQIEMAMLLAKLDMNTFNGYIAAGFTKEQAMDLLKSSKIKANV